MKLIEGKNLDLLKKLNKFYKKFNKIESAEKTQLQERVDMLLNNIKGYETALEDIDRNQTEEEEIKRLQKELYDNEIRQKFLQAEGIVEDSISFDLEEFGDKKEDKKKIKMILNRFAIIEKLINIIQQRESKISKLKDKMQKLIDWNL